MADATRWWAALIDRLEARRVPVVVFFAGRWLAPFAHQLIEEGGIDSPYLITPDELSSVAWRNPPPFFHPTPAAHREYARLLYPALAPLLDWPPLSGGPPRWEAPVYRRGGQTRALARASHADLQTQVDRIIRADFVPGQSYRNQCGGGLDLETGVMGRGAIVFLRRAERARRLEIRVQRLHGVSFLYPLSFEVMIPSAGGGVRQELVLEESGPPEQVFSVELPPDIPAGVTIDVVMLAKRMTTTGLDLAPQTLRLLSITQKG